ncbi:MAG: hypothetical protein AAF829_11545 [Pseudomonadota bacterium]
MSNKKRDQLVKALDQFDLDIGILNFVERDALSTNHSPVTIHQTDRTPVVVDPDIGGDGSPRESCSTRFATVDICGLTRTGRDGSVRWKLSDYQCGPISQETAYEQPHGFVATAMTSSPVLVTARQRLLDNDVEFDVFTWQTDGMPAERIQFSWRYWVTSTVQVVE